MPYPRPISEGGHVAEFGERFLRVRLAPICIIRAHCASLCVLAKLRLIRPFFRFADATGGIMNASCPLRRPTGCSSGAQQC